MVYGIVKNVIHYLLAELGYQRLQKEKNLKDLLKKLKQVLLKNKYYVLNYNYLLGF